MGILETQGCEAQFGWEVEWRRAPCESAGAGQCPGFPRLCPGFLGFPYSQPNYL